MNPKTRHETKLIFCKQ